MSISRGLSNASHAAAITGYIVLTATLWLLSSGAGLSSPQIEYGNVDGINEGTDACDPDEVFAKMKKEKLLIPPVDLNVRGIAVRVPYKAEENREVGTHGFTRNDGAKFHAGTDLLGDEGESVLAVTSGRIIAAGLSQTLGNYAILRTDVVVPPALPCAIDVVYAHLQSPAKTGEVFAGTEIGKMGRTGNVESNIPTHLHIEIWVSGYSPGLEARKKFTRDIIVLFRPF